MIDTYVDLEEDVKPYLNIGMNDHTKDKLLERLIRSTAAILNSAMGVSTLAKHTVTNERIEKGGSVIHVRDFPVLSITELKHGDGALYSNLAQDYIYNRNEILLYDYLDVGTGYNAGKITYVAGYVTKKQSQEGDYEGQEITFPDDLVEANLILISALYTKSQNRGVRSYNIQGKSVTFATDEDYKEFLTLMNRYSGIYVAAI